MPSASLISSLISPASNALPGAGRKDAPAFSYDAAVAALERSSARALDIHGGTPSQKATGAQGAESRAPQNAAAAPAAPEPAATSRSEQTATPATAASPATESLPSSALSPAIVTATLATAAAAPQSAPATLPPPSGLQGAREAAARLKAEAPQPPAPTRLPAQTLRQFAEILARRLDNASQFDLRLDPPALGSIEGRLTLGDDGQAVLALSFDNQPAFDLFRRDETALRLELAQAGFDLGGQDLRFTFRAPPSDPATVSKRETGAEAPPTDFFAPSPLHRGAIDIRA